MKIKTAVIIGAGNVATHLGKALVKSGIKVIQVYSPSDSAKKLAKKLNTSYTNDVRGIAVGDINILAVKDDALPELAKKLNFGNALVVHTAGGVAANVLKPCSSNYGVLYPFQTFNKNVKVNFANVPLCIEANTQAALKALENLASQLVKKQYILSSDQRQWLHIMGVFTANFTNLMLRAAKDIGDKQGIPFDIIYPLIDQTVAKVKTHHPANVQTGPAYRGDKEVISKHLTKLNKHKEYKAVYQLLSDTIEKLNNAH